MIFETCRCIFKENVKHGIWKWIVEIINEKFFLSSAFPRIFVEILMNIWEYECVFETIYSFCFYICTFSTFPFESQHISSSDARKRWTDNKHLLHWKAFMQNSSGLIFNISIEFLSYDFIMQREALRFSTYSVYVLTSLNLVKKYMNMYCLCQYIHPFKSPLSFIFTYNVTYLHTWGFYFLDICLHFYFL